MHIRGLSAVNAEAQLCCLICTTYTSAYLPSYGFLLAPSALICAAAG